MAVHWLDLEGTKCFHTICKSGSESGRYVSTAEPSVFESYLQSGSSGKVKLLTGSDFDHGRSKPTTPPVLVD